MAKSGEFHYSATQRYQKYEAAKDYERQRYSSLLGRYRHWREHRAVTDTVDELPAGVVIVDCPCGNGRWWETLARRAERIVALDVSVGMLRYAGERRSRTSLDVNLIFGNAEALPLGDASVDYAFCHALMKHLPVPVQYAALRELSRISRKGVIASFGIFSHVTYEFWRRRPSVKSYPIFVEQLGWMAGQAGLVIRSRRRCTTPLGLEFTVRFDKQT